MQHSTDGKWKGDGFAHHTIKTGSNLNGIRDIQIQNIEIHEKTCTFKIQPQAIGFETASGGPCTEQHAQSKFAWLDRISFSVLDDPFRQDWPHW